MAQPIHILGAGSIGLLCAHLIRTALPSIPIIILPSTSSSSGELKIRVRAEKETYEVNKLQEDDGKTIHQLLVTTKAHQTQQAYQPLIQQQRFLPSTLHVFLQNGLFIHTLLLPYLPQHPQIVLGTTTHAVHRDRMPKGPLNALETSINWVGKGNTYLAPTPGTNLTSSHLLWLSKLGDMVEFPLLQDKLFYKAALNACINPVTALYGIKNGIIAESRHNSELSHVWKWVENLAGEVKLVYAKARPHMDMSRLEEEVVDLAAKTKENINSMLADVRNGRETEIDFINGAIVEMGREWNVSTPSNVAIIKLIKSTRLES